MRETERVLVVWATAPPSMRETERVLAPWGRGDARMRESERVLVIWGEPEKPGGGIWFIGLGQ